MSVLTPLEKTVFDAFVHQPTWESVTRYITDGRVDVNTQDEDGNTLLHHAAKMGSVARIGWLLENGAQVDTKNKQAWQPIHQAAQQSHIPAIEQLLAAGANPNVRTLSGSFPSHIAAWHGPQKLKLFLDAGADIYAMDGNHRTIEDLAKFTGDEAAIHLVEQYLNFPELPRWSEPLSKVSLLAVEEGKGGMLDNPDTWHRLDDVAKRLASNGEYLNVADLMEQNEQGTTWLERAVECRVFPRLLEHLNAKGEWIGADVLLGDDGTLSPVAELLTNKGCLGDVFSESNWQGGISELQQVRDAIGDEAARQVTNWHSLSAAVARRSREQAQEITI